MPNQYLSRYAKFDTHFLRHDPTPWVPFEGQPRRADRHVGIAVAIVALACVVLL